MKYKGQDVPKSGIAGVKQIDRGIHKGKWRAFYKSPENLIHTGPVRELKGQALCDLTLIRARIYV